jgi:hypothetical protein
MTAFFVVSRMAAGEGDSLYILQSPLPSEVSAALKGRSIGVVVNSLGFAWDGTWLSAPVLLVMTKVSATVQELIIAKTPGSHYYCALYQLAKQKFPTPLTSECLRLVRKVAVLMVDLGGEEPSPMSSNSASLKRVSFSDFEVRQESPTNDIFDYFCGRVRKMLTLWDKHIRKMKRRETILIAIVPYACWEEPLKRVFLKAMDSYFLQTGKSFAEVIAKECLAEVEKVAVPSGPIEERAEPLLHQLQGRDDCVKLVRGVCEEKEFENRFQEYEMTRFSPVLYSPGKTPRSAMRVPPSIQEEVIETESI